jgi:DNA-binding NarL/FixJ family response regulator
MGDDVAICIPTIEVQAERPLLQTDRLTQEREEDDSSKANGFIAVIESRIFLQECIRRSMQSAFSLPILTCSTLSELELGLKAASAAIVIVSLLETSDEVNTNVLHALSELLPNVPVVVLAQKNDVHLARTAIRHGAKGYIPCTLGFDITIEAVRFVLAGGTYVPMDCVLATEPSVAAAPVARLSGGVTAREVAVIRALQQGKSNKVIAYELNMCESTVKVHVRNLMKKMKAKNRTDLAMRAQIPTAATVSMAALSRTSRDGANQSGCSHAWPAPTTGSRVPSGGWDLPHQADPTEWSEQTSITLRGPLPLHSDRCTVHTGPPAQASATT